MSQVQILPPRPSMHNKIKVLFLGFALLNDLYVCFMQVKSMNVNYYFLCSYPLAPDSIIQPGNWGRIMNSYNLANPNIYWLPLRELMFENIRLKEFPAKPSRFSSAFLCESVEDAKAFRQASSRFFDLLYEVSLVNPELPNHRGCLSLFDNANQGNMIDLENRARYYWAGTNIQKPELISISPIRILRNISV